MEKLHMHVYHTPFHINMHDKNIIYIFIGEKSDSVVDIYFNFAL
jgi:hypothetical protein